MGETSTVPEGHVPGQLKRSVGFYGLMFVSLGSIIGSGWLLGALNAAKVAGPASILSWILAAGMLALLALIYAELGAAYPVAGGGGRFAYYSHGSVAGFTAGWAAWLQAVFIGPIEVLACITYINSTAWVSEHFNMLDDGGLLNARGLIVAVILMLVFTAMNLVGAELLSEGNSIVVIWKTAVPLMALVVVASLQFKPGNFHAGGGFMPFGFHGVFAALTGGVVFALQGFEQAVQLAGEARNPKRDLSRAILTAMAIGAGLYAALQIVLIGALKPGDLRDGWASPLGSVSDYGAWYTLALAVGAGWLAKVLLIDAVISPAGTGVVYVGTTARLSYALGEEREMPSALSRTNARGVPWISVLFGSAVGMIGLGPFPSWSSLVGAVTGATAIMYGIAPLALAALHKSDPDRPRSYQVPMPGLVLPAAFASANLIIYWGGFDTTIKIVSAMVVGLAIFAVGSSQAGTGSLKMIKHALWIGPWLGGHLVIGALGQYGDSAHHVIPDWWDIIVVILFSTAIFQWAVRARLDVTGVNHQLARDAHQLNYEHSPA
jgi:amino acid transporter